MTNSHRPDWRELCNAAITTSDPEKMLQILRDLNAALEEEQTARREQHDIQMGNSKPRS